jgi:ADP-ribose pyrophosphatase YjhB (NUDIX family)
MLTDPDIGIVTGKGAYWYWGPNKTADPIVINDGKVFLVQRKDTGMWSLPGGFMDHSEDSNVAARREFWEESHIHIPKCVIGRTVYQGPVADPRITANAWPETTAILYHINGNMPEAEITEETTGWKWMPVNEVIGGGILFGSHRYLIIKAL